MNRPLNEYIELTGISQTALAKIIGKSQQYVGVQTQREGVFVTFDQTTEEISRIWWEKDIFRKD